MKNGLTTYPRIRSLDVLRGLTVAFMVLVNNPGSWEHIYWPLEHAEWHGFTPTDGVFPFFVFMVGASLALTTKTFDLSLVALRTLKILSLGLLLNCYSRILWAEPEVLVRTVFSLFWGVLLLGSFSKETQWKIVGAFLACFVLLINLDADFEKVRIPGVLQRIALVYFVTAVLYQRLKLKTLVTVGAGILVFYAAIMILWQKTNAPSENFLPEHNLAGLIDHWLFGLHNYRNATWDPEGLLSTLPAVGTCIMGVYTCELFKKDDIRNAAILGLVSIFLACILNGLFPINKALWTSTFVLLAGGLAVLFWLVFHYFFDMLQIKTWLTKILEIFGQNAILVFFGSGLIPRVLSGIKLGEDSNLLEAIYQNAIVPFWKTPVDASLAGGLIFVGIWALILWVLHKAKVAIKI